MHDHYLQIGNKSNWPLEIEHVNQIRQFMNTTLQFLFKTIPVQIK